MSNAAITATHARPRSPRLILGIVVALGLVLITEPMLMLGREPARWIWHHGPANWSTRPWIFVGLAIIFQSIVGVCAIAVTRRLLVRFDPNLRWPPAKTYLKAAVAIGIAMGVIMLVADYWPLAIAGKAPTDYPTDPVDVAGWLFAMGITGIAEEPIFRGLFVGVLVIFIPARVRVGRVDLPAAAFIVAVMFAAAHWRSFQHDPLPEALAQQSYAIVWGLTYVWLMERSRSLLAPIVAHGIGDAVEVGLSIVWRELAGV